VLRGTRWKYPRRFIADLLHVSESNSVLATYGRRLYAELRRRDVRLKHRLRQLVKLYGAADDIQRSLQPRSLHRLSRTAFSPAVPIPPRPRSRPQQHCIRGPAEFIAEVRAGLVRVTITSKQGSGRNGRPATPDSILCWFLRRMGAEQISSNNRSYMEHCPEAHDLRWSLPTTAIRMIGFLPVSFHRFPYRKVTGFA